MEIVENLAMADKQVTSTEFQNKAGVYLDNAGRAPVFITRHNRPYRVLIDILDYERLKSFDTRRAYAPHELPDAIKAELDKGYQGEETPQLDHLLR
jgi:prevent-host-death family protein